MRECFTGLDIGTTKVCVCMAEVDESASAQPEVVGIGVAPSAGFRHGMVVDLELASEAVAEAVSKAEQMAGTEAGRAYVAVGGPHIGWLSSRGVVAVLGEDREVTADDVERVLEASSVVALPPDREVIQVLPSEFTIDGCRGIKNPLGMVGFRLEVTSHIITGSVTAIHNVVRSVTRAGLEVAGRMLVPLASGEAVLRPHEKESGVAVMDIGGGTIGAAVFFDGTLQHAVVIPAGGNYITSDIALGLRIPLDLAERAKVESGCASESALGLASLSDPGRGAGAGAGAGVGAPAAGAEHPGDGVVTLPVGSGVLKASRRQIASIIEARARELLEMAASGVRLHDVRGSLPCGVVLTGGCATMPGMAALASEVWGLPARVGFPEGVAGLSDMARDPALACAIGLVKSAARDAGARAGAGPRRKGRRSFWARVVDSAKGVFVP